MVVAGLLNTWRAARSAVRAIDFVRTEQGRPVLAVADAEGNIHLYDPATGDRFTRDDGTQVTVGSCGGDPVYDMVWLPRSAGWPHLVAVGGGGTTHTYDLSTGKEDIRARRTLRDVRLRVVDVLQEPDGSATIAVAGMSDTAYLWRGGSETPVPLPGHKGPVRALKVLRGERRMAVAHEGGITVWDLSEQPAASICFGEGDNRSLAVIRDSLGRQRLASACPHGIQLWDPDNGDQLAHFARALSVGVMVAFEAQDGEPLLAAASGDAVTLWSPATEEKSRVKLADVHVGTITALARIRTSRGNLLAAAGDTGLVAVWLLPNQRSLAGVHGNHDDWVNALTLVPAQGTDRPELLASASDDRTVRLWRVNIAQPAIAELKHDSQVQALALVRDGLAAGDEDGVVRVWSLANHGGTERWSHKTDYGPVRAMVSFAKGTHLVSAGGSGHCIVWDATSGQQLRQLRPIGRDPSSSADVLIRALAAAKVDGGWRVAAGDSSGRIEIWNPENETSIFFRDRAHPAQVRSLAMVYTASGVLLASGGDDGAIRLWAPSADGLELVHEKLDAHCGQVAALHPVTAGGLRLLASGGADRSIRLWDPESPDRPVSEVFNAHHNWVRALAQVPVDSATLLASGGEDSTIRLLQLEKDQLLRSTPNVNIRGFRDRLATFDLLDRRDIVKELHELLIPNQDPDQPSGTSGPQVVMIQGPWGTGKSSLMRDLRNALDDTRQTLAQDPLQEGQTERPLQRWRRWRLRELSPLQAERLMRAAAAPPPAKRLPTRHTITAWFNPWAHESAEQVWSGLAWSIIDATRDKLGATQSERQRYWLSRNAQRLDRAALRRSIHQRIWRPTLAACVALLVPLTVALVDGRADLLTQLPKSASGWVLIVVGVFFVLLALFATYQYFFGRVTSYLPADILDGPVLPTSSVSVAGEKLQRDLPYLTTTGPLYRAKEDVHQLVKDLGDRGYQVVVFIDDLDRCTSRSVTEVFEAVNSFLFNQQPSDLFNQHSPESAPRFVIGLDPGVVAARLRDASSIASQGRAHQDPDDPDPGWSLLRKLCQLTVVLPGIRSAHTVRLLRRHIPSPSDSNRPASHTRDETQHSQASVRSEKAHATVARHQRDDISGHDAHDSSTGAVSPQAVDSKVPLEGDPTVQEHLRQLVMLRPRQTMRETKRLLTLWGFYMRLLSRVMPLSATANALGACNVLTLAEIVRRWPALVPALARTGDGPSGLRILINAALDRNDDNSSAKWNKALARLGLSGSEYASSTANLRELLREHGNKAVADFADCLL